MARETPTLLPGKGWIFALFLLASLPFLAAFTSAWEELPAPHRSTYTEMAGRVAGDSPR